MAAERGKWKIPHTLCAMIILLVNTKGSTDSDMAKKQQEWRSPKFYDPLLKYTNLIYFIVPVSYFFGTLSSFLAFSTGL